METLMGGMFSSGDFKVTAGGFLGGTKASGLTEAQAMAKARDLSRDGNTYVVKDRSDNEIASFKNGR